MKQTLKFKTFFVAAAAVALVTITSCGKDDPPPPAPAPNTITDKVVADASFTLLEQAVIRANLATTLSGTGPFTVFAPDDAAFTAAGFTATAINNTTPTALSSLLLYHTIPARILAAAVPAGPNARVVTASGDSVFVTRNASGVFVNGVRVTAADITADNGIIHKVGRVIRPATGNIVQTAVANTGLLDSLVKAVTRATTAPGGDPNLASTLSTATLTVFAPTNAAFTQLLTALSLQDINQIPIATLLSVLRLHVVNPATAARAFSSDLANGSLPMLAGSTTVALSANAATIRGAGNTSTAPNIIATDIMARNGVVHVIDRVLLP